MSVLFTAADTDSISVLAAIATEYATNSLRVTIPFTVSANPVAAQVLFYLGDKDSATDYLEILLNTDGTMACRHRGVDSAYATTANSVATDGSVNVVTIIIDDGSTTPTKMRIRIKLNGGSVATHNSVNAPGGANWDKTGFGGNLRTSSPGGYFSGTISQPFAVLDDDNFADHDAVWNSGTPLDPSGLALSETHRWPFDTETGSVTGTDVAIDDAVGAFDFDTVGGSPIYAADIFFVEDAGAQTGAFTSCTINGPRTATFVFAEPTSYHWNSSFTEASAKRPSFTVTSPTPDGGTDTRTVGVASIKTAALNGTNLEIVVYLDSPVKNGDTLTVTGAAGWYTDLDADVTAAMSASAVTNSVGAGFAWPLAIARWATVPYQVVSGTGYIEALAFHKWGMDSMVFKQGATTLATVAMAGQAANGYVLSSVDSLRVLRSAITASSYADGLTAFDFVATPVWGTSSAIRNTATDATVGSLSLYMNSGGTLTTTEYWVDGVGGNDTTGDGSELTPWATIEKAVVAWKAAGTDRFIIYCADATYTYTADLTSPTDCSTWCIITKATGATEAGVIINGDSKNLGVQRLCYRDVTIPPSGANEIGESQTFGGNSAVWIDSCTISGPGQQYAQASGSWIEDSGGWDEKYVTDSTIADLTTRGIQHAQIVRNTTITGVQETGVYQCDVVMGVTCTDVAKYGGSVQHPDGIGWFSADTDSCSIVSQCKFLDIQGQLLFSDVNLQNVAIVASLFVQRTDLQYLVDFGKNTGDQTQKHILIDGCTFPNAVFTASSGAPTDSDVFSDIVIRNTVAEQFNLDIGDDDFDIRCEDCHGIAAEYTGRYTLGTQSTGAAGFTNGSVGNYDAGAVDYSPTTSAAIVNRVQSVLSNYYDIDGVATQAGSAIGSEQAAAPTITSITPDTITLGSSGTWTIAGTGFVDGITPTVDGGVTLGATIWNSAEEIEVDWAPASAVGSWTMTLTNPDGQTDTITFDVVSAAATSGAGAWHGRPGKQTFRRIWWEE